MIWTFRLPTPPSTNNLFVNAPGVGRVKGKKYKAWMRDADKYLTAQRRPAEPITYRVTLEIQVPRIKNADISNRIKAAEDMMVKAGIMRDDYLVERVSAEWIEGPECIVTIAPFEARK